MTRRESRPGGGAPTDLLVCFPSRAHLSLMPKPICSPSRPTDPPTKRNQHHHSRFNNRGQASPLFRTKHTNTKNTDTNTRNKSMGSDISEPTSPKVTCAGQIKVRHKPNSCKNWQSVMEEIERIHNNQKQRKRPNWLESLGLKKDVMQFLTALRGIRFDLRCFGSFNGSVDTDNSSDDEDEDDHDEDQQKNEMGGEGSSGSRTIFSKWFMVLQENNNNHSKSSEFNKMEEREGDERENVVAPAVPPSNALLLMRCRSAPAKGWLQEKGRDEEEEKKKSLKEQLEEEKKNDSLVLTSYAPDFFKVSTEIAKETWVVGSRDPLSRSRSWKR